MYDNFLTKNNCCAPAHYVIIIKYFGASVQYQILAYLHYSWLDCTIPEKWSFLKDYLNINGLDEVLIRGDGLCLLNAICKSSYMDHNIPLTITSLQNKYFITWKLKGIHIFLGMIVQRKNLCSYVQEFFSEKKYNTQGVDLIVFIAAEVLALDIRIFQEEKSTGYMRITQTTKSRSGKIINLKFSYNSHSSVGNHYDSIFQMKTSNIFPITQESNFQNTSLAHEQIFNDDFSSPIDLTTSPAKVNLVDSGIYLTWSPPPPTLPDMSSDIEELGSDSNSPNDEEVDTYLMKMRQGVSFPFHFLQDVNEEEVDKLPPEINGSRKYKIKATISNYTELVKDSSGSKCQGRQWQIHTILGELGDVEGHLFVTIKHALSCQPRERKTHQISSSPVVSECAILVAIVQQVHPVMLEN